MIRLVSLIMNFTMVMCLYFNWLYMLKLHPGSGRLPATQSECANVKLYYITSESNFGLVGAGSLAQW